jgi:hypothetical protein
MQNYFTMNGFDEIVISSHPARIGIPKIETVNLVPITLRTIPDRTQLQAAPSAIIATIQAN